MNRLENLDYIIRNLLAEQGLSQQIPASLGEKQQLMRALMNVWQPRPLSRELIEAQDRELLQQRTDRGIVALQDIAGEAPHVHPLANTPQLLLWQGDITRLQVDAIVNAANSQMLGCWLPLHACIDNCIHSAAGLQLRWECYEQMQRQGHDEPTGTARLTGGYNLPARYVLHTVGPIIPGGFPTPGQEVQLASCYRACLEKADAAKCQSIAFCCISTGVFHFPNQRAAEIAVATVRTWLQAHPDSHVRTVVFNVFLDKDHDIYQKLLQPARA